MKGIIVFHAMDEFAAKAEALLKTLCCEVLARHENRFTIKTSRGNLQSIKRRWQEQLSDSPVNQDLHACVSQIIIGGTAR